MSNFKAGDKVVCVTREAWFEHLSGGLVSGVICPVRGVTYLVTFVSFRSNVLWLSLAGYDDDDQWEARAFEKLETATERAEMEHEARV